jgi:hypothetical protein
MLSNILKLENLQKLTKDEQKSIYGGTPVQPENCTCFCYNGPTKVYYYCYAWCPDGSLPGIEVGSPGSCTSPMPPKPPVKPGIE